MARVTPRRRSRRAIVATASVVAVVALVTTLAVVAQGYDAQKVPRLESAVWVMRDSGQYARVNTDLGEIDTVRSVSDPSDVVQSGSQGVVFTQGDRQLWPVDAADPVDLVGQGVPASAGTTTAGAASATAAVAKNSPQGTRSVVSAGDYLAYLTDVGKVYVATIADDGSNPASASVTTPVDPLAGSGTKGTGYVATAVAVSDDGEVALYSAAEGGIRRFDASTGTFEGSVTTVPSGPAKDAKVELAIVGGKWVLSAPGEKKVWVQGRSGPSTTTLGSDARLQTSASTGTRAYLADSKALDAVDLGSGTVTKVASGSGTPAAPTVVAGTVYAAWLGTGAGRLWSSATSKTIALKTEGSTLDQVKAIVPVFRTNGQRAVLSEQSSGMLWNVPDGKLIPVAQWTLDDKQQNAGTVKVDDVAQEQPPVAVSDSFGVRSGALVELPLLLNDYDPNKKDVISIVPDSISAGLSDPAFGDVHLVSNDQEAVVQVRAGSGSATFSYTVTDGSAASAPASVTLTVVDSSTNTAPVWCGVDACVEKWPTPQISPGGTITVNALTGWVDPQGDPIVLTDARKDNASDPVTIVPKSDGTIAIRHSDPNAPDSVIPITVTVSDALGASTTKTLDLTVTGNPALVVAPVALVAGVNQKTSMSIADHVTGGSGSYRLVDATSTSTSGSGLVVVPNTAAGEIDLTASTPGEYSLTYSVEDTQTQAQQAAIVRLTVVNSGTSLAMAPLTAFVRADEDTTIDVLSAVQNTSGRVLIVQSAATTDADLSASVVGQSAVRVSGSTDTGLPGRVGTATITVTDGAGSTVTGTLTVFLVPSSTDVGPIAEPDTVTVRAGGQVDIPVLANDVSPRGERLVVHPDIKGSGAPGELAFVSGDEVRYLAPTKPGVYTLQYSVYLENAPTRLDTASITVTVLADGANRAPLPPILTARVLAGQTVAIPVDSYGMDPDGDTVVLAGVDQPKAGQGTASISADGTSIVYAAPGNGIPSGQLTFNYEVRDSKGATATGIVRVGVLTTATADTAPVTYSDYVRVQQNSTTPVTVAPLLNDSDPAQGKLTVVGLVPNAPGGAGNPEYDRLQSLVDKTTSLKDDSVVLKAGDVLGTHSYIYTVQSSKSSSTSQGLIVVTVSDEPSPDVPTIADTVLTAKSRSQLATGVDVVSGNVQWPTGDVSTLKLALWGSSAGYTVNGWKISGKLPKGGDIVPFSLSGTNSAGQKVVSYGFLRIPAFDDMRVQLAANVKPVSVGEEKSVDFDVSGMLDLASTDTIEVRHDSSYDVQRANSTCVPDSGTKATYTAGRNAPWTDSCTVPVRIVGQKVWTLLAVPLEIVPKDPQAQLNSISRTVAPGATETVQLYNDMTTWEGNRVGDKSLLIYSAAYTGSSFAVTPQGTTVTIEARADAKPGTRENVQVSVAAYGGLTANIAIIVGIAPPDTPRGATFTQQCDVSKGPTCSIKVIGQPGEYDPFLGKIGAGLHLEGVGASSSGGSVTCAVATVTTAGDTQVTATWPSGAKPVGGTCVVPYTVSDAQNRTGLGQLTIDVQGYPQKPASIVNDTYTATSVTMTVDLGDANQAHPGVTGVVIYEGSNKVNADCQAGTGSYSCTVSGLVNGVPHTFTARAVNSVGEGPDTSPLTTHSYAAPVIQDLSATPEYDSAATTTKGAVLLQIEAEGDDVRSFHVNETNQDITRTGTDTTATIIVPVSTTSITLVPSSQYSPPTGGTNVGDSITRGVTVAGKPFFTSEPSETPASDNAITVSGAAMDTNGSTISPDFIYLAYADATVPPTCSDSSDGGLTVTGATLQSNNTTITGLTKNSYYWLTECGSAGYGSAQSGTLRFFFPGTTAAPAPDGNHTYTVSTSVNNASASTQKYLFVNTSPGDAPSGYKAYYIVDNDPSTRDTTPALVDTEIPSSVQIEYCSIFYDSFCSTAIGMAAAANHPPAPVTVTFPSACVADDQTASLVAVSGSVPTADYSVAAAYTDSSKTKVLFTVTWPGTTNPFLNLDNATFTQDVCP